MIERPLLMSGPLVRKTIERLKTHTRRTSGLETINLDPDVYDEKPPRHMGDEAWMFTRSGGAMGGGYVALCPYGKPGDRLWVREAWASDDGGKTVYYRADGETYNAGLPWKPSIHMPRKHCRLLLDVVAVRPERLQRISYADCCREIGAPLEWPGLEPEPYQRQMHTIFRDVWDRLYAKRGYGWDRNPWVWAVEYKVAEED